MKVTITKSKSGHYTATIRSAKKAVRFSYLDNIEIARWLADQAKSFLDKPRSEWSHFGHHMREL